MLRVAEHAERTDTGRHRRSNEDAFFARSPLFVVADGMGGAQAGEVASRTAVEVIGDGVPGGDGSVEDRLRAVVQSANDQIHALSLADEDRAGMGTTLTAVHVGEREITVAHVGDSRCYRMRDGELERLTVDHTLVEELVRQGQLRPDQVGDHPQRSVVTRVLGPEALVRVDSHTFSGRDGDVLLLCSDGLTSMVDEATIAATLRDEDSLRAAVVRLVELANAAGGRDNITVLALRLEEVDGAHGHDAHTQVGGALRADDVRRAAAAAEHDGPPAASTRTAPSQRAVQRRVPLPPAPSAQRRRHVPAPLVAVLVIGAIVFAGGYLATQAVYFVGADDDGFVTVYRGVPYDVLGMRLYNPVYISGVSAAQLSERQRQNTLGHDLRSREDADDLVRQLELGRVGAE